MIRRSAPQMGLGGGSLEADIPSHPGSLSTYMIHVSSLCLRRRLTVPSARHITDLERGPKPRSQRPRTPIPILNPFSRMKRRSHFFEKYPVRQSLPIPIGPAPAPVANDLRAGGAVGHGGCHDCPLVVEMSPSRSEKERSCLKRRRRRRRRRRIKDHGPLDLGAQRRCLSPPAYHSKKDFLGNRWEIDLFVAFRSLETPLKPTSAGTYPPLGKSRQQRKSPDKESDSMADMQSPQRKMSRVRPTFCGIRKKTLRRKKKKEFLATTSRTDDDRYDSWTDPLS